MSVIAGSPPPTLPLTLPKKERREGNLISSDVLLYVCGGPRPRSRKGRLPAPGGRKGVASQQRRQEITEIADTERAKAYVFAGSSFFVLLRGRGPDGSAQWPPVGWSASTRRASRPLAPDRNATATKVPQNVALGTRVGDTGRR